MTEDFSWAKISSATSEIHGMEIGLYTSSGIDATGYSSIQSVAIHRI